MILIEDCPSIIWAKTGLPKQVHLGNWFISKDLRLGKKQEARNREKFLKSGSGREFLKVNIPL